MKSPAIAFLLLSMFPPQAGASTILFAVTRNAHLYKSTDGAKTWHALPITGETNPASSPVLGLDPRNPANLYIGAFSGVKRAINGDVVHDFFRSTDGGATWVVGDFPTGRTVARLVVDPNSTNIIYASSTNTSSGFFRSTDSGATWGAVTLADAVSSLDADPKQPGVLYAGTISGKVYKSADYGLSWTTLTTNPGFRVVGVTASGTIHGVAADPNNANNLYVAAEGTCLVSNTLVNCGLFQSTDGGKNWQRATGIDAWYKNVVVDGRNGNVYGAGVIPSPVRSGQVVRSTDGGKTWTRIVQGMKTLGAEIHLDPESAATLYANQAEIISDLGPGGGVFVSTDTGANWVLDPVDATLGTDDEVLLLSAISSDVAPTPQNSVPAIQAVVNAASFQSAISANCWVSIYGTNLAAQNADWSSAIVNGKLPTTLNGVSVTMGGKPAYVNFISSGLINVLAPDLTPGPITVTVTTGAGTSAPFNATAGAASPAFFLWPNNQAVATRQNYTFAAKAGTFQGAITAPAQPGDVLILWGTGFGATNPGAPAGSVVPSDQVYNAGTVAVSINNAPALIYGAALAPGAAGLYQIAIQVPSTLTTGDWPIQASIGGVQSPAGAILSVTRPGATR